MSLAVLQASVLQTNGALSVAAGAQITVRTPANVLATLYEERAGTTPAGNPVTADSAGFFRVYTTPGRYNITVTTSSGTQVYNDVVIEAEAEAKRNIAAADPDVTNDETEGYSDWSLWANSATSQVFRCIDATEGAAVWVKTTLTIDELGTAALEDVGTTIGDVVQLEDVGGSPGLPAVDGSQLTGIASSGSGTPIGGYVTVQTDLTGAEEPDPDTHIKLEAGLTGAGQYNEGKLGSESVTGSAPLVVATAQITDAESPLNGQTVHLLETERRFLRAGNAGTVENDQMQRVTGAFLSAAPGSATRVEEGAFSFRESVSSNGYTGGGERDIYDFDSADSPDARTGDSTVVKNIGVSVYMRIK